MNRPLRIGIDVDDILNNFNIHWVSEFNKQYGYNLDPLDIVDWDLTNFVPDGQWYNFMKVSEQPEFYEGLEVDKVAQLVIKELIDTNNTADVYLITGTYPQNVKYKSDWIKKYFPFVPQENILYIRHQNKYLVNVDIMIEDCPVNIEKYTCPVILLNKNYNMSVDTNKHSDIHRVNSWLDIRQIFVEKFDILPETNPEIEEYLNNFGNPNIESSTVEGETERIKQCKITKQVLHCETPEEIDNILQPYFKTLFNSGYSCALKDIANCLKQLDELEQSAEE